MSSADAAGPVAADPSGGRPTWAPQVGANAVQLRVADPLREWDGVRLEVDWILETDPEFTSAPGGWALDLPRPHAWRLEYQLTLRRNGEYHWTRDPGNPRWVPNPFGEKSEIRFPDYREPAWLMTPMAGPIREVETPAGRLERPVPVHLWSPVGLPADARAPLLVAHDGLDMAERGSLLAWATQHAARQPLRVALLDPPVGLRDDWYAANPDYADHLAEVLLPAIASRVLTGPIIGLGASLGALAMLAVQRRHPGSMSALALQSGSFFTPALDPQESRYSHFAQVCAAVRLITRGPELAAATAPRPAPVLITCGAIEENRANNEAMAGVLADQGHPVTLRVVPDAHTMIGWRNAWFPALDELVTSVR